MRLIKNHLEVFFVEVFVRDVAAGIRYDARSNDRTACAQPRDKEIYDFVFERGKGTAIFDVYEYTTISTKLFIKTPPHNNYPIILSLHYQKTTL